MSNLIFAPGNSHPGTRGWLDRLVAHDTTSRHSNLALIAEVEAYLKTIGVASRRVPAPDEDKASLFFSIGPDVPGGVVLSGHTDVVPIDGQRWSSDPWIVTERDGRLYGRGTVDMKGFLATALAAIPAMRDGALRRPVHFALSYDEEVGCLGAPALIEALGASVPAPAAVIVGEPTGMKMVDRHKGIIGVRTTVTGHEAHSSQTHLGVAATMVAARLMNWLVERAAALETAPAHDNGFVPAHATLTIGLVAGGTAPNIMARHCSFVWDIRSAEQGEASALLTEFRAYAADVELSIRRRFDDCGIETEILSDVPALQPVADSAAIALAMRLTGDNACEAASFVAEAGQFQRAGLSTVICGPGSIAQAHQPDEYITIEQLRRSEQFMLDLISELAR